MANIVYAGQNLTTYFSTGVEADMTDSNLTLGQFNKGNGGSDRYLLAEPPYWEDASAATYALWDNTDININGRGTYYPYISEYTAATPGDAYTPGSPEVNNIWYNSFIIRNNTPNTTLTFNFTYSYRRVTTDAIAFQIRKNYSTVMQSWAPTTVEVPSATNVIQVTSSNFTLVNSGSPVSEPWGLYTSITAGTGTDYIAARWFRCNFVSLT